MSDIPEDVMKAACSVTDGVDGLISSVVGTELVARAIMAERERAAKIAEQFKSAPSCFYSGLEQSACLYGQEFAAGAIAEAIRRGN